MFIDFQTEMSKLFVHSETKQTNNQNRNGLENEEEFFSEQLSVE